MYFDRETKKEKEIRTLSTRALRPRRLGWAQNGALKVSHGWKPETGLYQIPLGRLQRGADSLCARAWIADPPLTRGELCGVDAHL